MFDKFFAQGVAVDAQPLCCNGLVLFGMAHDGFEQGFFCRVHKNVV